MQADQTQIIDYPFPHVRRLHAQLRFDVEPVSTNKRKPIIRGGKPAIIQTARAEAHNEHLRWLVKLQHKLPPLDCPIALAVTVVFERPKSYPAGPRMWHTNTPDLDNITKGVQDALKAVWVDDRKVTQVANLKVWGATGETAHYEIDIYELQPIPQHVHFWVPDYENDASKCAKCGIIDKTVKPPRRISKHLADVTTDMDWMNIERDRLMATVPKPTRCWKCRRTWKVGETGLCVCGEAK